MTKLLISMFKPAITFPENLCTFYDPDETSGLQLNGFKISNRAR